MPDQDSFELAHPIYLDTPMLVSFLAALDDGVYYSSEVAEKLGKTRKSDGEISGAAKLPSLASLLGLNLSASGKYSRQGAEDQNVESKFVREHTSASLFNRLRSRLHSDGLVQIISPDVDIAEVRPGALIEVTGTIETDPMRTIIDFFQSLWPFIEGEHEKTQVLPAVKRTQRRNMSPERRAELEALEVQQALAKEAFEEQQQTMKLVDMMKSDLESSPIVDLVLRNERVSGLITASREFFGTEVAAALLGGTFSLVGKVAAVNPRQDAETPVIRRGAMSTVINTGVVPMLELMRQNFEDHNIQLSVPDPFIKGPCLQVIPLAIFV
ncbi:hypothetical protein ABZ215_00630 [Amycolatopsis sp. NPDC006131]|uniref:DUF6414 family protein n=1 Tax=Amycolatopsis sp. NPDC006131 TaxID=3156731 RepID=UPI0033AB44CE